MWNAATNRHFSYQPTASNPRSEYSVRRLSVNPYYILDKLPLTPNQIKAAGCKKLTMQRPTLIILVRETRLSAGKSIITLAEFDLLVDGVPVCHDWVSPCVLVFYFVHFRHLSHIYTYITTYPTWPLFGISCWLFQPSFDLPTPNTCTHFIYSTYLCIYSDSVQSALYLYCTQSASSCCPTTVDIYATCVLADFSLALGLTYGISSYPVVTKFAVLDCEIKEYLSTLLRSTLFVPHLF